MSFWSAPATVDGVTLQESGGTISVKDGGVTNVKQTASLPLVARQSGNAAAGAVVITLTATAGYALVGWTIFAAKSSTVSADLDFRLTYTDDTTETLVGSPGADRQFYSVNAAGLIREDITAPGVSTQPWTNTSSKKVKKIEVLVTAASTTGDVQGIASAWQEKA